MAIPSSPRRRTRLLICCLALMSELHLPVHEHVCANAQATTTYPTSGVSCKDFVLADGITTVDIASWATCSYACKDRYDDYRTRSFDHGERIAYETYRVGDMMLIGLMVECYCNANVAPYEVYMCGRTMIKSFPAPNPGLLPRCDDQLGADIRILSKPSAGQSACSRYCMETYAISPNYGADRWTTYWQAKYRMYPSYECSCRLSDDFKVVVCSGHSSNSSSNSNNEDDSAQLVGGIVVAVVVCMFIAYVGYKKKARNAATRHNNADPALSDFRQQRRQQRRRQQQQTAGRPTGVITAAAAASTTPTPSAPQLSAEEQHIIRQDMIKSSLFSHILTEDGDVKTLASIIASTSSDKVANSNSEQDGTSGEIEGGSSDAVDGGGGTSTNTGIMDTLRSTLSSVMSHQHKPECSICLMTYETGDVVSWGRSDDCDHLFHESCIMSWLNTIKRDGETLHDSCPLCRTKLI
mmetsp:Transcript_29133/g.64235  ORF Transcript_29133/g.64235 Transcript_29133/m.64235 type:complete len:466 (-) Transcript_29133:135-1532(-)